MPPEVQALWSVEVWSGQESRYHEPNPIEVSNGLRKQNSNGCNLKMLPIRFEYLQQPHALGIPSK
jgi:hypothetical protein